MQKQTPQLNLNVQGLNLRVHRNFKRFIPNKSLHLWNRHMIELLIKISHECVAFFFFLIHGKYVVSNLYLGR